MAKTYYSVLTTYGTQLFAQAIASGKPAQITQFAVGDGNGRAVTPDATRTTLVKQVHRANISAISVDPRNNKQVIFELTIPEHIGGFWIREMGIFDANNRLVAYSNCPETYKPLLNEGSGKIQVMRMILAVSSSNAVTLTVDDSIIFATRGQLTPQTITASSRNSVDNSGHSHQIDHATLTQKGITQLTNDTGLDSESLALSAKAGKTLSQQIAQHTLALGRKVNLTGNETISGEKTFINRLKAHNGIRIGYTDSLVGQGHYAEMFADGNTVWLNFKNRVFRWHADGGFSSDNNPFLMSKPLGTSDLNAVNVVGVYGQNANVNATTARHYPANEAGSLQVLPSAYGVMQIYTTFGTKKSYIRNQASGGSWENTWTRVDIGAIARATTAQQGLTQLTNDTGLDSETLALSAKAGKALSQQIAQVQQNQANYLLKNKKSSVVNSTSEETIATSKAVKTAYDKGEEAKRLAQSKQSPQTTLSGYGISDGVKFKYLEHEDLNAVTQIGIYGQGANVNATSARHYPVSEAGTLVVSPSAYGVMQSYTTYSTKSQYVRNQLESGWNAWVRVDGIEAMRIAQSKQSPQTTLSGYGITDAVKQLDMRGTHNRVRFDDASPAQLPQGSFVGLSEKAALESRIAHGWKFISKGWSDQSGAYSCVRLGITDNRFYFQTARDWNNWNAPLEIHHSGLGYLSATTSNYGGINIERPDRNDKMLMESNGNQFAFIRRNRGNGQNHYAILLPERSGTAMLSGDVTVLTGTIAHGGTIPLPAGFTEAQCKWFVSANTIWDDVSGNDLLYFQVSANGTRQVTCSVEGKVSKKSKANYLIIGVK